MNIEETKKICSLCGVSGNEDEVREYIINEIKNHCEYSIDPLGNIIAFKKGKNKPKNRLMFAAHTDEVGFIVTNINSDGTLNIAPVGGITPSVVVCGKVYFPKQKIYGLAGRKPIHRLSKSEREKPVEFDDIYIDIGAKNAEEAEKIVKRGDIVSYVPDFEVLGGNKIVSKAIDDRAGCLALIDMIKNYDEYDYYGVFTVQEEIGLRGAEAAAYTVNPDIAVVLETTTAADFTDGDESEKVCKLGDGVVILYKDRRTMYDRELYSLANDVAEKNNIKHQTKTKVAGGNDAGAIQISHGGTRVLTVSVPCRNLHSPSVVADTRDYDAMNELAKKLAGAFANL